MKTEQQHPKTAGRTANLIRYYIQRPQDPQATWYDLNHIKRIVSDAGGYHTRRIYMNGKETEPDVVAFSLPENDTLTMQFIVKEIQIQLNVHMVIIKEKNWGN